MSTISTYRWGGISKIGGVYQTRRDSVDKAVQEAYTRFKKIFKDIEPKKLEMNDDLIKNVAFMSVTLNKLQDEINQKGVVEKFEQGKQNFMRENPALKSYNTTIKNYTSAIKQLCDLLPEQSKKDAGENLLKFVANS